MVEQKVEKKKEQAERKGEFSHPDIFGGKLKIFLKGSDPNDPKNYRDLEPEELKIYEENKLEEDKNMADDAGLVTRAELMKRDMDGMKKELEAKIAASREVDLELKGRVQQLDDKVCKGEECYTRIERKQDDMLKILEDRFKSLSEPRFVCRKCNASSIRKGDKACSVCGDSVDVVWN